jgi:hypothetical protein
MAASEAPETNTLPPTRPGDFGLNVTFKATLCPGFKIRGEAGPLIENSLPAVWNANRLTRQERLFVSTTGTVELVPIATWPNDTAEGLAVTASLVVPAPVTSSIRLACDALLVNRIAPPLYPSDVGVKETLTSTLCPDCRTSGRLKPDAVNSALVAVAPDTVTLVCPVFVTVVSKVSV